MYKFAIPFVALWLSFAQSASVVPLRTGDVARQLTDEDLAAIKLVLAADANPWLLNGDPGMLAYDWRIEAHLTPTVTTPSLRRGTSITVTRRISPPTDWAAQPAQSYAQVAITGRKFDDIQGDQDINRPFRIVGDLSDNDVLQIVAAVRSGQVTVRQEVRPIRPWPIMALIRQNDGSVQVMTRQAAGAGQGIWFYFEGQKWNAVEVSFWVS